MSQKLNDAAKRLGREAVRELIDTIGPGFHPDTAIGFAGMKGDYVDASGKPLFSGDDAKWGAQRLLDFAWETLGDDIYAVALEMAKVQ